MISAPRAAAPFSAGCRRQALRRRAAPFPNTPLREADGLYWDAAKLWQEIQRGIAIAVSRGASLDGIGVDTWGVDFALLGGNDQLLERPRHYRDARNNGMMEKLFEYVPRDEVFGYTGIQMMQQSQFLQHLLRLRVRIALRRTELGRRDHRVEAPIAQVSTVACHP